MKLLDLHFTQINVLGNQAEIHNQLFVGLLEWIVLAWALLQYTVWFNDVGAARELRQAIKDNCERCLGERVATEAIPQWVKSATVDEIQHQHRQSGSQSPLGEVGFKYRATYVRMHGDGTHIERAADVEVDAVMRLPEQRGEVISAKHRFERVITSDEWRHQWKVSRRSVLLHSRFLLEYFAPFALALLPVVVTAGPIVVRAIRQLPWAK